MAYDAALKPSVTPHNLDAEAGIIGTILIDNNEFWRVCEIVQPTDFYSLAHKWLYRRIAMLIEAGQAADEKTLRDKVEASVEMSTVGGFEYLIKLLDYAAIGPEIQDWARMVSDMGARRAILATAEALREKALAPVGETTSIELLGDARSMLDQVEDRTARETVWESAGDCVREELIQIEIQQAEGRPRGLPIGISKLDDALGGLHRGDLMVIGGASSMGKTALATNICIGAARTEGVKVAFFSQEMSKQQLAWRMACSTARRLGYMQHDKLIEYRDLRNGKIGQNELAILRAGLNGIPKGFIWNTARGLTFNDIRAGIRRARREHGGIDVVCIDYLQIMNIEQERGENFNRSIGKITAGLKRLAGDENVHMILLSQLSRAIESRENKRPRMTDLKESGSIENDADTVIFPYREEYYLQSQQPAWDRREDYLKWQMDMKTVQGVMEIITGKQRMGSRDAVTLHFEKETDTIVDDARQLTEEVLV